jgi:hypothetical protein
VRKAFIILACELAVLAAVVAVFLFSESPDVRTPANFAAVDAPAPVRAPASVPVSLNRGTSTGRVMTAQLRVRGGKAIIVTTR